MVLIVSAGYDANAKFEMRSDGRMARCLMFARVHRLGERLYRDPPLRHYPDTGEGKRLTSRCRQRLERQRGVKKVSDDGPHSVRRWRPWADAPELPQGPDCAYTLNRTRLVNEVRGPGAGPLIREKKMAKLNGPSASAAERSQPTGMRRQLEMHRFDFSSR